MLKLSSYLIRIGLLQGVICDAGSHYEGVFISDEMPWYLHGQKYRYDGDPALAHLRRGGFRTEVVARAIDSRLTAPLRNQANVVNAVVRTERVMSVGSCQLL